MADGVELTLADRRKLADLYRLVSTSQDSDIVTQLSAGLDEYRHLLHVGIAVKTHARCRCCSSFRDGSAATCSSDMDMILDNIRAGICSHLDPSQPTRGQVRSLHLIHLATFLKKTQTVLFLLNSNKQSVNSKVGLSWKMPLEIAMENDDCELCGILLSHGASQVFGLYEQEIAWSPAIKTGNCKMVKSFVEAGSNVNAKWSEEIGPDYHQDILIRSPLSLAVNMGFGDIARVLLDAGADPNEKLNGDYVFCLAAGRGALDIVKLLIPYVDVNATDRCGNTALHWAAFKGDKECIDMLMAVGVNPNIRNKDNANTLGIAVNAKHVDIVRYLVCLNVDLNVSAVGISPWGQRRMRFRKRTPLCVGVEEDLPEMIDILLIAGYNIWRDEWLKLGALRRDKMDDDREAMVRHLEHLSSEPPTLQHRCKMFFRKTYGLRLGQVMERLVLPNRLKDYVMLKTLLSN